MVLFNTSHVGGFIMENVSQHILGDYAILGVWLLVLFIGFAMAFRIDFNLALMISVPFVIGFMAFGLMSKVIGGIILVIVSFILGANFLFNR